MNVSQIREPLLDPDGGSAFERLSAENEGSGVDISTSPAANGGKTESMVFRHKIKSALVALFLVVFWVALGLGSSGALEARQRGCVDNANTTCVVIGSTPSNLAQGLLPLVYLLALALAWYMETPRRSGWQFGMDNMKQIVSGSVTHFEATAAAVLLQSLADSAPPGSLDYVSECDWYLVIFMFDTSFGCTATILTHAATARFAARFDWSEPLSRVGDYEAKPAADGSIVDSTKKQRLWRWIAQILHWTLVAVLCRGAVYGVIFGLQSTLRRVAVMLGAWACTPTENVTKTYLNVILWPLLMDSMQVVLQSFALQPHGPSGPKDESTAIHG